MSVTKVIMENHVREDPGRQLSDIERQQSSISNISSISNNSEIERQQQEIEKQQQEIEKQQKEMERQQREVDRQQKELQRQKQEMERQHKREMEKLERDMREMKEQMMQLKTSKKEVEELKEQMEKKVEEKENEQEKPKSEVKKTTGHVQLKRLCTFDPKLYLAGNLAVVPSTGDVVIYGKSTATDKLAFHIYHYTNDRLTHRVMNDVCEHDFYVRMLPVTVEEQDLLAITCPGCRDIKLFSVRTGSLVTAYENEKYIPYRMCHGNKGRIFAHSYNAPFDVIELDSTEMDFTGPTQTLESLGMWECWGMCYLPDPYNAVVLTDANNGTIRAISYERDNVLWEIKGKKVDGTKCEPRGVLFYPEHQVVLVCDGSNERVLVLNPKDGSHMDTIEQDRRMGKIINMGLYRDQAVMLHYAHNKLKVSFFSIS